MYRSEVAMLQDKIKHKYNVYLVGLGNGCYANEYHKTFMGETWAYSEKQAANNIHFRLRQAGESLPDTQVDSQGLGRVVYVLKAERA